MIRCLIALLIARLSLGSADVICTDSSRESKLLHNFGKLLDRDNVKLYNGIRLKRKLDAVGRVDSETNTTCVTMTDLAGAISRKIAQFPATHVIELDLASLIPRGKDSSIIKFPILKKLQLR